MTIKQRSLNKKTMLYLEQQIIKNNLHKRSVEIYKFKEGFRFLMSSLEDAKILISFLKTVVPFEIKKSHESEFEDVKNTDSCSNNFSLEIPEICKDDLIVIP